MALPLNIRLAHAWPKIAETHRYFVCGVLKDNKGSDLVTFHDRKLCQSVIQQYMVILSQVTGVACVLFDMLLCLLSV